MDQYQINVHEKNKSIKNESLLDDLCLQYLPMYNPGLVAIIRLPDTKIFFINSQFEYHLGYSNSDLTGKGLYFNNLLENNQHDHLINQLNNVNNSLTGLSAFVIYALKNKNGNVIPFYLYAGPFLPDNNPHGKLYFIQMHPDLSKWGMPFTSFDSKELFLEQFNMEYFGTYEWIMDADKTYCSAGIYRIYEIDKNRHKQNTFSAIEFVHPNDKTRVIAATKNALETGADLNIEYRIITDRQNIKLIHCLARTIKNEAGKPVKFAGSIRDITEQRTIEETLKNKVEELKHSNRELEEFAYVASHDMQEPLRKITTFSDRLSEKYKDVLTGEGAMYLTRMIASAENMRTLINDLLEFSRISKTEQPFEPVNLNFILRQVKTDLELIIEETGTIINSPALPIIEAIPSQMKQLFGNIINNAIKFRKPGVPSVITIETNMLSEKEKLQLDLVQAGPYYKIQVSDNGIGFEKEYATRIFQVFQRLHGKSEYPGSGIGLAICKKILEYHTGIIYAENIPRKGSRFVFIIPQRQQKTKDKL